VRESGNLARQKVLLETFFENANSDHRPQQSNADLVLQRFLLENAFVGTLLRDVVVEGFHIPVQPHIEDTCMGERARPLPRGPAGADAMRRRNDIHWALRVG
jgi:hypothetical protein